MRLCCDVFPDATRVLLVQPDDLVLRTPEKTLDVLLPPAADEEFVNGLPTDFDSETQQLVESEMATGVFNLIKPVDDDVDGTGGTFYQFEKRVRSESGAALEIPLPIACQRPEFTAKCCAEVCIKGNKLKEEGLEHRECCCFFVVPQEGEQLVAFVVAWFTTREAT